MKKLIPILFIVLFCFSIGIAGIQEKELSKKETAENLDKQLKIIYRIIYLYEEIERLEKELKQLEKQIGKPEQYDFSFLDGIKPLEEKKKDELSWREKYIVYPSGNSALDTLYESYKAGHISAKLFFRLYEAGKKATDQVEEEHKRIDNIRRMEREIQRIEFNMETERMMFFNDMMFFNQLFYLSYPGYSIKMDRTNYEPLLFTLCTEPKGKMDWIKYGWFKLLLKRR